MGQKNKRLTPKQELFCHEYLIDMNATQAAVRAGYRASSATRQSSRMLSDQAVQSYVSLLMAERNRQLAIDANYVLKQAVELHERCMQQISPKRFRNQEVIDEQGNPVYEFDAANALKALELIGKHVNVGAFKERLEMSGDVLNAHFVLAPLSDFKSPKLATSEDEVK